MKINVPFLFPQPVLDLPFSAQSIPFCLHLSRYGNWRFIFVFHRHSVNRKPISVMLTSIIVRNGVAQNVHSPFILYTITLYFHLQHHIFLSFHAN